ncbi:hypothetical protein IQ274_26610 [Nostoc sp. LEGE 12447]|uniref:hypothetical protein n=1 Tax=Nostoc sp. LEGE 12447 TaxID=1828640 RepID=UPI0018837764|nr:hypothetical protein [Nostoc sp. LEGE 12447]MBE9001682.1 hypothetical protein [Nostoc sp. LEGE 12447]
MRSPLREYEYSWCVGVARRRHRLFLHYHQKCDRLYKSMIRDVIACFKPITRSAIAFTRI